ncbi:MAG: L-serine ammonia-lyase, iron-sulfur-dependent, subunit alpha [Clostridia bacterium]|nr:L-serine ammonia-lyase, iron-sulfur-dependent, subunit alpha [Clostridia bacterium]
MQKTDPRYAAYTAILQKHLRPAMGCTEPIAIAYAAAVARRVLGVLPQRAQVWVSGNIIKNAMAVTVPNTGGRKGIDAACAAGLIAGDAGRELQVIADVSDAQRSEISDYLAHRPITVSLKPDARLFDILVQAEANGHHAAVRIADRHTNVVEVERDGQSLYHRELEAQDAGQEADERLLTIEGIFDFANTCDLADVQQEIQRQIVCNSAIAQEGLSGRWGASVGKVLLDCYGTSDVRIRARAYAAAGSDARMSGCEMPVIINSGSGNQGLTVSLPVIQYARELHAPDGLLIRALVMANLTAIREKALIGTLSAYCGAISAGCAAGAGIAYICGGDLHLINHTIVNSLAILSGTICDGAKPSCAAKIASAVDAAITGYQMACAGKEFRGGEGIVKKGVENTIASVGRLGKDGMKQTDEEILKIMIDC